MRRQNVTIVIKLKKGSFPCVLVTNARRWMCCDVMKFVYILNRFLYEPSLFTRKSKTTKNCRSRLTCWHLNWCCFCSVNRREYLVRYEIIEMKKLKLVCKSWNWTYILLDIYFWNVTFFVYSGRCCFFWFISTIRKMNLNKWYSFLNYCKTPLIDCPVPSCWTERNNDEPAKSLVIQPILLLFSYSQNLYIDPVILRLKLFCR